MLLASHDLLVRPLRLPEPFLAVVLDDESALGASPSVSVEGGQGSDEAHAFAWLDEAVFDRVFCVLQVSVGFAEHCFSESVSEAHGLGLNHL